MNFGQTLTCADLLVTCALVYSVRDASVRGPWGRPEFHTLTSVAERRLHSPSMKFGPAPQSPFFCWFRVLVVAEVTHAWTPSNLFARCISDIKHNAICKKPYAQT